MKQTPILCYHQVGPESEYGRWLNVEPQQLTKQIGFFVRRGYKAVTGGELSDSWGPRQFCLTFDDGYEGTLTYGLDVMVKLGVTGSIYVVPEKVGLTSDWDEDRARPLADWEMLQKAQSLGFEIGNHTVDHCRLAQLKQSEQAAKLQSAQEILARKGLQARSVCFPYGSYSAVTEAAMRDSGQTLGLALGKQIAREDDPRWRLPRIPLSFRDSVPLMLYKVFIRPKLKTRQAVVNSGETG